MPFQDAIDYFRQKVNVPTKHWTAIMDEAHARSFMVAGATSDALLEDFRQAIDKAIAQGTGFKEFRGDFDAIVRKHGWSHTGTADWRAKIIYNTNMANAFSAGRYAQATNPDVLDAFPYWEYLHVNCPHPRLQHVAWSGMVLRADDPWWNTNYPPNGWNCHCIVGLVNDRGLAARGKSGPDKAPDLTWQTYIDRTTGVVTKYPAGVDPGFAYNPGKAWLEGKKQPMKAPRVKLYGPPAPVLAPPGETAVKPEVLDQFIAAPKGSVQVGTLTAKTAARLKTKSRAALLSADTLAKQISRHPEVKPAAYAGLAELLAAPLLVLDLGRPRQLAVFGVINGEMMRATVKEADEGRETYVVSLHRIGLKSFIAMLRNAKVVLGSAAVVRKSLEED
jgi:hypothetical protein